MLTAEKTEYQKLMATMKPTLEGLPQKFDIIKTALKFNEPGVQNGELLSANCHGSGRGMAKLASIMANEGKYNQGKQSEEGEKEINLISQDTWKKMHDKEKLSTDTNMIGMSKLQFN